MTILIKRDAATSSTRLHGNGRVTLKARCQYRIRHRHRRHHQWLPVLAERSQQRCSH